MRWGNYDTATDTVRFVAGEVPSTLASPFLNPIPTAQLPPSFYLPATPKPAWFGLVPWPPIGPG